MLTCSDIAVKGIIKGISFSACGGFTALIGKNGSGKSTLCECVCALRKHSGTILIDGKNTESFSPAERAARIAFLPQILPTPSISVYELAMLGRSSYIGLSKKPSWEDTQAVANAVRRVNLIGFENRMLSTLSGGERQRAFLAMILAQDTDILVLDEPTSFLDAAAEAEYISLLSDLAKSGKTLLVSMHNLSLAVKYSDNILVLNGGNQAFFGSTAEILKNEVIENTFGVRRIKSQDEVFFLA